MTKTLERVFTPMLGNDALLRPGTSDHQVWADTFTGLYHLPPEGMLEPRAVLDLGANIGLTTAHYGKLWPGATIYGVEPNWESFEVSYWNAPHAHLQWLAAASWSGPGWYNPSVLAEATTIRQDVRQDRPANALLEREEHYAEVWCVTLGEWMDAHGPIDFCKMDIEGAEWAIFKQNDWAGCVQHLLVELHGPDPLKHGIAALRRLGFDVEPHTSHPQALWAVRP